MKLKALERLFKKGVAMRKVRVPAIYGIFNSSPAVYDHKTCYSYEEVVDATNEGWWFEKGHEIFTLCFLEAVYYGLKELAEKYEDIKNLPVTKNTSLSPKRSPRSNRGRSKAHRTQHS